ncbi:MAG: YebC/PmpR family DNA-binding transcriptional regulator [Blastochloris viridis]|uniref:Probable transcriptional regulatory protein DI628_06140 n=1 Tax=Blastochloris viridis TaxID=1079 RepID=A0A6N4RBP0_BLAVI|nr:MAG: YebC/PmpR family DNA-binding transcriptional regulator [Blastochloris viridis]
MAGHSKFKNIQHRKAAQDKKKAKIYTKYIRDIMTAARSGGGDITSNPTLRTLVDKARKENMTNEVVTRAIKRGTGEIAGADYIERTYEGYGPGGVAVFVTTLTDNPTRTITNVRTAFSKNGGNVGTDGSVAWMFKQVGQITYPARVANVDQMLEAGIMAGAEDVESDEMEHIITTSVGGFGTVRDTLAEDFGEAENAELAYIPTQMQAVTSLETAQTVMKMVDILENDDDVQSVVTNMDVSEHIAAQL